MEELCQDATMKVTNTTAAQLTAKTRYVVPPQNQSCLYN